MIAYVIERIRRELAETFAAVYTWLEEEDMLLDYKPRNGGWTVRQNLEHISLTNHYLLIIITKATAKAAERLSKTDLANALTEYEFDWHKMEAIGVHKSFEWIRPEHMEPTGLPTLDEIRGKLKQQQAACIDCLDKLGNGEGILYKTMMSVSGLGKIDVYHYIYFLVQHAKRHIVQMEKIRQEFDKQ